MGSGLSGLLVLRVLCASQGRNVLGWKPESVSKAFVSAGLVTGSSGDPCPGRATRPGFMVTTGLVRRTWESFSCGFPWRRLSRGNNPVHAQARPAPLPEEARRPDPQQISTCAPSCGAGFPPVSLQLPLGVARWLGGFLIGRPGEWGLAVSLGPDSVGPNRTTFAFKGRSFLCILLRNTHENRSRHTWLRTPVLFPKPTCGLASCHTTRGSHISRIPLILCLKDIWSMAR